jgi:DNA polymerase-3 subunit chi
MVPEVSFYQLQKTSLEHSLPRLLEKIFHAQKKTVVLFGTPERLSLFNALLWTYSPGSFLPHGSSKEGAAESQPIWLTNTLENPNEAEILIAVEDQEVNNFLTFSRCLDIYDGNDPEAEAKANNRKKKYRALGCPILIWQQDEKGAWHENAA